MLGNRAVGAMLARPVIQAELTATEMPTPNFEYDLFISYAHIDNQHYSGVPQGWVDYLHERLQVSLSRRLGRAPRIWRDRKLRGNDVFDDEIKQTLANAAIPSPAHAARGPRT